MKFANISAFEGDHINVIVETPLGSRVKYVYDPEMDVMRMKHQLPYGYFFAFNFGFIPNTQAEDGDPLDVVVYSNEPCISGALIECRVAGALLAKQRKNGKTVRNDRIIAVPAGVKIYDSIKNIRDIDRRVRSQMENFFVSYENYRGILFKTIKWISSTQALAAIKKALSE
ncbi:MAG TPA: inorganic diphosphatase [Chryseolinea sp.]|nr:inorganic diphosphatase [Chryseolinea sp.]